MAHDMQQSKQKRGYTSSLPHRAVGWIAKDDEKRDVGNSGAEPASVTCYMYIFHDKAEREEHTWLHAEDRDLDYA